MATDRLLRHKRDCSLQISSLVHLLAKQRLNGISDLLPPGVSGSDG
jgi:hypothetical protein